MTNPFSVVKDFENAVAQYTGAPYCVAVNSCTNALFLCLVYHKLHKVRKMTRDYHTVEIPKRTYVSVPMQIMHAEFFVSFRDEEWEGAYQLKPFNIWDAARRFTSNMWKDIVYDKDGYTGPDYFVCTSHHWSKILGVQQGGCILHNSQQADQWFRRARFDGRTEGIHPKNDSIKQLGWHMYMSPEIAAEGLVRLHHLPKNNEDLPNDDYPDLSKLEIFK